jgi:serine/threonine protein kinase/tetratricopeptide (TPR) repeat protein
VAIKCPKCQSENPDNKQFCGDCGTKLTPIEEVQPSFTKTLETPVEKLTRGALFADRYEIIEELGAGGMGKVYRVEDTKAHEEIALKIIRPEVAADKKTIERFRNELTTARKIRHKNVCGMYDLGEHEGIHYITMEYVTGEDLKTLIRRVTFDSRAVIKIAKQVCDGLAEAHRLGVVHRDLKSNNIMVDKEGNARIMDFGIARSLEAKGLTGTGVIIGTPEYMSPEQVEGKEVDQRSDIYSLGIILYEMVTGRVPFEGDTPFTIGMKHKGEMPQNPKKLNAQIPDDLNRVILRCLEKDKEKRYRGVEEVLSELVNIEKGIPATEREIPERKPITSKEISVTFGLKKLLIPALAVIVIIAAAIIIWRLIPPKKVAPLAPGGKPSLAVMYFKNNTGDVSRDNMRTMLPDLLIADLSQSKYLKVLSMERLFQILGQLNQLEAETYSADVLQEVAIQGGINHVLLGSYAKMGDVFRIDVVIQKAGTGEIIGSEHIYARGEEDVFPKVDELTRKIKQDFRLSEEEISSDMDKKVEEITTSSPEAYKYYTEAIKVSSDSRMSISLMEKAVEIDPEFAMAYSHMATQYWRLGFISERNKYFQKALELKDRLSDRESHLVQASIYLESEKAYDKAIEAYTRLLELYPEDTNGNIYFGILYKQIEEWDKAIERIEVAVHNVPQAQTFIDSLAEAYRGKGSFNEAWKVLEEYINNYSDNAEIRRELTKVSIDRGELDLALAESDRAFILNPTHYENFLLRGDIFFLKGDSEKAREEYRNLLKVTEPLGQWRGSQRLIHLNMAQGKFEEAISLCKRSIEMAIKTGGEGGRISWGHNSLAGCLLLKGDYQQALKEHDLAWDSATKAGDLSGQRSALYMKGRIYLEMGSLEEAQKAADELRQMIEQGMNQKVMRLYHHLMGRIELVKGNISRATEYFKEAISLLSSGPLTHRADFIAFLALAYREAGDLEKACQEYEKIAQLTSGRIAYGYVYAKSFYTLAKIHEQQGDTNKAIEHYEKFLTLWRDADPGIAEVEDARKRLARLKET